MKKTAQNHSSKTDEVWDFFGVFSQIFVHFKWILVISIKKRFQNILGKSLYVLKLGNENVNLLPGQQTVVSSVAPKWHQWVGGQELKSFFGSHFLSADWLKVWLTMGQGLTRSFCISWARWLRGAGFYWIFGSILDIHTHTHARAHTHTHARALTHTHTDTHTRTPIYARTQTYLHRHTRARTHTPIYTHARTRTYLHTHTHTHTPFFCFLHVVWHDSLVTKLFWLPIVPA